MQIISQFAPLPLAQPEKAPQWQWAFLTVSTSATGQ